MTLTSDERKLFDYVVYTATHNTYRGWSMGPDYAMMCQHMRLDRPAVKQLIDTLEAVGYLSYPRNKRGHRILRLVDWVDVVEVVE